MKFAVRNSFKKCGLVVSMNVGILLSAWMKGDDDE